MLGCNTLGATAGRGMDETSRSTFIAELALRQHWIVSCEGGVSHSPPDLIVGPNWRLFCHILRAMMHSVHSSDGLDRQPARGGWATTHLRRAALAVITLTFAACGGSGTDGGLTGTTGRDVTPPSVTSVSPANSATGVAITTSVVATFSEPLTAATLTGASFALAAASGAAVAGTVTLSGNTATFAPSATLAAGTLYTATISPAVKDAAGNALAATYVWTFTTAAAVPAPDTTAPTVTSTSPTAGATAVALNAAVSATFSEPMTNGTLTTSSVTLVGTGGAAVSGVVLVTGNTVTFTPTASLAANTLYTATVTTAAKDAAGNALASNYTWMFATGAAADVTPPTIIGNTPANSATNVAIAVTPTVTFSEPMQNATLTTASVTLVATGSGTPVSGSVSVSGNTATFAPTAALANSTQYTVTVTTAAKDIAGNALAANASWSFTTVAVADVTPPTITASTPANGATNVAIAVTPTVTFSEPMQNASLTTTSVTLVATGSGTPVSGSVGVTGNTATFTPGTALANGTQYTATVTTAAKDLAGNALTANTSWSFTTVAAADVTPPTIIGNTPANGATNVAIAVTPTVTFSEPMQNATLTTASVTLKTTAGSVAVSGSVSVSGNTATFTPGTALANGTQYTATVTTAAKDVAGNALAANASWSFTTAAAVSGGSPSLGAQAVAFKFDGSSSAAVSIAPITTRASGSTIIACVGRGVLVAHAAVTDNKGNTYTQLGTSHAYTRWGASGTACYAATNAIGGAGHVVTAPSSSSWPTDETTLSVVEIINATRVQDFQWNEDLSSPLTSQSVTTTGPATLIALWWGDGNSATMHTATPDNGFSVIHSVLSTGNLVQTAAATKNVSAAGSYNVNWTSGEGAQLWIFAVQP